MQVHKVLQGTMVGNWKIIREMLEKLLSANQEFSIPKFASGAAI